LNNQTLLLQYKKLPEEERETFLNDKFDQLSCDGCGLPINGAFKVLPREPLVILHIFPSKDEVCKQRFCSSCGTNVNTIERRCTYKILGESCDTILSEQDSECPKCQSRFDIQITSNCKKCETPNKEHLTQSLNKETKN
jgi:hypothetical protein